MINLDTPQGIYIYIYIYFFFFHKKPIKILIAVKLRQLFNQLEIILVSCKVILTVEVCILAKVFQVAESYRVEHSQTKPYARHKFILPCLGAKKIVVTYCSVMDYL